MATADEIGLVKSFYGEEAKAGTYEVGGKTIEYGGPGSSASEAQDTVQGEDKKRTPDSWEGPVDARTLEGAGKYPNYYSHKTRSGHTFMMDDSAGAEHVTIQHRGGTMIQIGPTGTLNITAHNGQYNIIFGENRMMITGAYDVTVQGDASLRIDGDYDVQVNGDISLNAHGDLNLAGKNVNTVARGNIDIQGKNRTEKIEGSITQQAQGAQTILADSGMTIGAMTGNLAVMAGGMMSLVAKLGALMVRAGAAIGIKAEGLVGVEAKGAVTVAAGGALTMSAVGTSSLCSVGPLVLYGTPITQNLAFIQAPPALDGAIMFLHRPALPAIPDPQGALDFLSDV